MRILRDENVPLFYECKKKKRKIDRLPVKVRRLKWVCSETQLKI